MRNKPFREPIQIGDELVFNPLQAQSFLRTKRPNCTDPQFATALDAILAVLDGRGEVDEARLKVEAALKSVSLN